MYHIAQTLDDDYEPPRLEDFGFYHGFADVQRAAHYLTQHNILPYRGGLFDQPLTIMQDIETYLAVRSRVRWENEKTKERAKVVNHYE